MLAWALLLQVPPSQGLPSRRLLSPVPPLQALPSLGPRALPSQEPPSLPSWALQGPPSLGPPLQGPPSQPVFPLRHRRRRQQ